jgi:hypothetical protein
VGNVMPVSSIVSDISKYNEEYEKILLDLFAII